MLRQRHGGHGFLNALEGDALQRLDQLGFLARAPTGDEGGWREGLRTALALAKVVVVGDNDASGVRLGEKRAALLNGALKFPPPAYKDIDQWILADEAMHYLTSENGELADEVVQAMSPDWVRNHPENKGRRIAAEDGDVLMMLAAVLMSLETPVCPIEAMFEEWRSKGFPIKES